jgi:putative Holliday junction resolvase
MRTAALDVGQVRIGIAISDELGLTVRRLGTVRRRGGAHDVDAVARLLAPWNPGQVVVGLPLNMDGSEGPRAAQMRAFAERLAAHLGRPVVLWDERLTTVEAEARLRERGIGRTQRRAMVDEESASIILESWLQRP